MKYSNVEIDWISQWILSHICDSDGFESTSSIVAALTVYDGVTENKVRRRLRQLRGEGLVVCETEHRENVADANLYQMNPNALDDLDGLSSPPDSSDGVGELESKVQELQVENNRLESDVRELQSQLQLLQDHFNSRGSERIGRIEENQDYLMEHAEVSELHLLAAVEIFNEHSIDFDAYLDEVREQSDVGPKEA
ncbi:hypothetical protein [Natranaeroarchaeum aerophilus]|uniref:Uncharacterized protein n=1 Tax=Natranaeroarchaeum aerophilus TaxID=2917711 RepID=A0AAE3FST8_9EURY|nr:hypothetical protein [Natranaeroarchaeum aerophilus]MCL9814400.1 hypothetical protein [Natranaeroarchaeum aerophilus]